MNMEKKMMYAAPEVEVLEIEMELGFAGSLVTPPDVEDGEY